jgi:hypothetical protein
LICEMAMAADQMSCVGPHEIEPIRAVDNVPVAIKPIRTADQARLSNRTAVPVLIALVLNAVAKWQVSITPPIWWSIVRNLPDWERQSQVF